MARTCRRCGGLHRRAAGPGHVAGHGATAARHRLACACSAGRRRLVVDRRPRRRCGCRRIRLVAGDLVADRTGTDRAGGAGRAAEAAARRNARPGCRGGREMTRQSITRIAVMVAVVLAATIGSVAQARQDAVGDVRNQLRDRYDVLILQDGVGLVPRSRDAGIRIIEIRNGAVSIDGMTATGDQLRMRLGADADLILRISYLDAAQQRQLAGDVPPPGGVQPGAALPPPVPPVPESGPRRERRGNEIVRFGADVTVDRDEIVEEVVVIGGNATINGEVDGELTVIGGNATLGPEAIIRDDVAIVGGTLNRAPGSVIEGRIQNVAVGDERWRGANFPGMVRDTIFRDTIGRVGSFAGTLLRIGFLALLALIVAAFGRTWVERIAERASTDPLRSGLTGFLGQVLFFPVLLITVVILAVSISGIPLLVLVPFAILAIIVVALVGYTGVADYVGGLLAGRIGWSDRGAY